MPCSRKQGCNLWKSSMSKLLSCMRLLHMLYISYETFSDFFSFHSSIKSKLELRGVSVIISNDKNIAKNKPFTRQT